MTASILQALADEPCLAESFAEVERVGAEYLSPSWHDLPLDERERIANHYSDACRIFSARVLGFVREARENDR